MPQACSSTVTRSYLSLSVVATRPTQQDLAVEQKVMDQGKSGYTAERSEA